MAEDGSGSAGGNGPVGGDGPTGGNRPTGGNDPALGGLLSRLARSMGPEGVELGGDNVRFEQDPDAGLEARITLLDDDGEPTSVASMLLPADEPPGAHPDGVPFVRNAPLRVIEDHVRGVVLAMWMLGDDGPDPETALAAVLRRSREAGWRIEVPEGDANALAMESAGPFRLLKGDQVRRVEARSGPTGPVVSLSQRRDVKDADLP